MSQAVKIDQIASNATEQYRALLASLVGIFARTLDQSDPTSPLARSRFQEEVRRTLAAFMLGVSDQIDTYTKEVRDDALASSTSVPDIASLDEHLAEMKDELRASIYACVRREGATAERELRHFAMKVDLMQASTGISRIGALIRTKYGRVRGLGFTQQDSLGRKWSSETFFRSLIRLHLVRAHVETRLFAIAKGGSDLAQVIDREGNPGEVFSITGITTDVRSYEDLRDDVFHPNSTATVAEYQE